MDKSEIYEMSIQPRTASFQLILFMRKRFVDVCESANQHSNNKFLFHNNSSSLFKNI